MGVGRNSRCGAELERCCDGKRRCGEETAGAGAKKEKRRPKEGELGKRGNGVRGSGFASWVSEAGNQMLAIVASPI